MFFGNKSIKLKSMNIRFTVDDYALTMVKQIKFLDVLFISSLNWSNPINYLNTKIAKNNSLSEFASRYFLVEILVKIYFAYIYPYLNYAICA